MARLTSPNANYRRHLKRKAKGNKLWAPGSSCTGCSVQSQTILVKKLGPSQSPLASFWAENDVSHIRLSTFLTLALNQLLLNCQLSQRSSVVHSVEVRNYQGKLNVYLYHSSDKQATGLLAHHIMHSPIQYSLGLLLITNIEALGRFQVTRQLFKQFQLNSRTILVQFTSLGTFCHVLL